MKIKITRKQIKSKEYPKVDNIENCVLTTEQIKILARLIYDSYNFENNNFKNETEN